MLLADFRIQQVDGLINPFIDHQVSDRVISYGLGSYGYDIRIGRKFKVFQPLYGEPGVVDPKNSNNGIWKDFEGDVCYIPPNSFALGCSIEIFNMPRDITGLVVGKSTYAHVATDCRPARLEGTNCYSRARRECEFSSGCNSILYSHNARHETRIKFDAVHFNVAGLQNGASGRSLIIRAATNCLRC